MDLDILDPGRRATELLDAVERMNYDEVNKLLDDGVDVNVQMEGTWITVLDQAAYWGRVEMVELLLNRGAECDTPIRLDTGMTMFQSAAYDGFEEIVRLMVAKSVNVNAAAGLVLGKTALQAAACRGHESVVIFLLENGADINAPAGENYGRTALQAAVENARETIVRLLIDKGADIDAPAGLKHGRTALQAAVEVGNGAVVNLLICEGADINAPAGEMGGRTALQAAAEKGHEPIIRFLIDKGANINAPAGKVSGRTALQAAAEVGDETIVNLLIDKGADINAAPGKIYGRTALQAAAARGHESLVQILIKKKADINAPAGEIRGKTALRAAIEHNDNDQMGEGSDGTEEDTDSDEESEAEGQEGINNMEGNKNNGADSGDEAKRAKKEREEVMMRIVKLLLENGAASEQTKDDRGQSVLHAECQNQQANSSPLLDLLLQHSTPRALNAKDFYGSTPLHHAVRQRDILVVQRLIEKDVNLDIKDSSGKTPFQLAFQGSEDDIAKSTLCKRLLLNGARTDGLVLDDLEALWKLTNNPDEKMQDVIILHDYLGKRKYTANIPEGPDLKQDDVQQGTYVASARKGLRLKKPFTNSPSICFRRSRNPSPQVETLAPPLQAENQILPTQTERSGSSSQTESLVDLKTFVQLDTILSTYPKLKKGELGAQWHWGILGSQGKKRDVQFSAGIPEPHEVSAGAEAILGCYVCFNYPTGSSQGSKGFIITEEKAEISWIMKQEKKASFLRSVHYRSSLDLSDLSIPQHSVHFVTASIDSIQKKWKEVIENAKLYLVYRGDTQLQDAGKKKETIKRLLQDSKEWSKLRKVWLENLKLTNDLLNHLKEQEVLVADVREAWKFREDYRAGVEASRREVLKGKKFKEGKQRAVAAEAGNEQGMEGPKKASGPGDPESGDLGSDTIAQNVMGEPNSREPTSELESASRETIQDNTKVQEIAIQKQHMTEDSASIKTKPQVTEESKSIQNPETLDPKTAAVLGATGKSAIEKSKPVSPKELKLVAIESKKPEEPKGGVPKLIKIVKMEELKAWKKLLKTFETFQRECEEGITELERETTKMIGLEFNLISIFEARRSIDTSVSMKRLSWITFIFLPLMFISGMFGMNVNLLQSGGPAWQWYFVIVIPFSIAVIIVWILCKYLPGVKRLEKSVDKFLRVVLSSRRDGGGTKNDGNPKSDSSAGDYKDEILKNHRAPNRSISGTATGIWGPSGNRRVTSSGSRETLEGQTRSGSVGRDEENVGGDQVMILERGNRIGKLARNMVLSVGLNVRS